MTIESQLMTGFFLPRACLLHDNGPGHPESPERLQSIHDALEKFSQPARLKICEPAPAEREILALIHPRDYIESIAAACGSAGNGRVRLDADTAVSQDSFTAAQFAAGAAITAADQVSRGELANAFCAIRPPGHHAERATAMGFCLFNNVALAAEWLVREKRAEKVLIIDWDVHHGNGTQDIFYERGDIFYLSLHQWPLYPGTGRENETGEGPGRGATRNVPLPPATTEQKYLDVFYKTTEEIFKKFKPDVLLLSAGFDAHRDDPLANLQMTEAGFGNLTKFAVELAESFCGGKVVALLEGGYNLTALANSVVAHVKVLAG